MDDRRLAEIENKLERLTALLEVGAVTSTANVSSPPTDAELDTAFGAASTLPGGFIGVVDDNNAHTTIWLCVAVGGVWGYEQLTIAV